MITNGMGPSPMANDLPEKVKTRSQILIATHITKVVIAILVTVTHPELRP
jgi:hypothetical protein